MIIILILVEVKEGNNFFHEEIKKSSKISQTEKLNSKRNLELIFVSTITTEFYHKLANTRPVRNSHVNLSFLSTPIPCFFFFLTSLRLFAEQEFVEFMKANLFDQILFSKLEQLSEDKNPILI